MPLAPQKFTVQMSVPLSLSHLDLWGPDFWDRDDWVPHSLRASLGENQSWASASLPMSPDVSWAEPLNAMYCLLCTCDGMAHCWIAFGVLVMVQCIAGVGLSAALLKLYIHCFSYDFMVGRWLANLLLTDDVMHLPPAIGPTLGANFHCRRL